MRTRRYLVLALSTALGVCSLSAVPAAQATTPPASTQSALAHADLAPGLRASTPRKGKWIRSGSKWYFRDDFNGLLQGWHQIGGARYFFNRHTYAMATGWVFDGGLWWYLRPSGAMATGWIMDGGKWYYLGGFGDMQTGWVPYRGEWYYLKPGSGEMVTGDVWINGKLETFLSDGRWYPNPPI